MPVPFRVLGRLHLLSVTGARQVHGHRSAQRRQLSKQGSCGMPTTSISAGSRSPGDLRTQGAFRRRHLAAARLPARQLCSRRVLRLEERAAGRAPEQPHRGEAGQPEQRGDHQAEHRRAEHGIDHRVQVAPDGKMSEIAA